MKGPYFAEFTLVLQLGDCKDMEEAIEQAFGAMEDMGDENTGVGLYKVYRKNSDLATEEVVFRGVGKPPKLHAVSEED